VDRELLPRRVLWVCLFGWVVVWAASAWVTDDAYITFRSVDLTLQGLGPRWNVLERVQAFSHPLWFLLLVVLGWLGMNLFWAATALSLVCSVATARLLLARAATPLVGAAVLALLCASKSFVEFSSSGLENALCHLLVVCIYFVGLGAGPVDGARRGVVLGVLCSAVALCRLDQLLLIAPMVGLLLWRGRGTRVLQGWMLGLLPLVGWELFSLLYYGDVLPNTACAKLNHDIGVRTRLEQGLAFYAVNLRYDHVTVPVVVLAGLLGIWRGGVRAAAAVGCLAYLAYIWWIPGDFMAGRFHSTPFALAVAIVVTASLRPRTVLALGAAGLALSLVNPRGPLRPDRLITGEPVDGVADERAYYWWDSRVQFTGEVNADGIKLGIRRSGGDLPTPPWDGAPPVVMARWGGLFAYEKGASHHLVDEMGLSDPLLSRLRVVSQPWNPSRPGHLQRVLPEGYLESLRTDRNAIEDPAIAALWDDVRLVTRGPLLSGRRLRAITGTVWCGAAHRSALDSGR